MAQIVHRQPAAHVSDAVRHWVTTILTIIGAVAALLGTWMHYGPDGGTLTFFGWTWDIADISELWPAWLMIGGGLLAALSMGWETYASRTAASRVLIAAEGVIVTAGIVAAVVGVILLF